MDKKKILIGIVIFALIICILIIIDRKFQITSLGYGNLDMEEEYVSIVCKYGPKEKNLIEDKEDIEKCINYINDLQVRKYDLLDQILDPKTYQRDQYLGTRYVMILNKQDLAVPFLCIARSLNLSKYYLLPVEPNPPSPLKVSLSSLTSLNTAVINGVITNCAIRSLGSTVTAMSEWL